MKSKEKRIDKLKQVLERLSRGEIVQNRQLKSVLGAKGYARYCYDYREQEQLHHKQTRFVQQSHLGSLKIMISTYVKHEL